MIKFQDPEGDIVFSFPEEHVKYLPRKGDLVYEKSVGEPIWKVIKVHHVIGAMMEVVVYVKRESYQ